MAVPIALLGGGRADVRRDRRRRAVDHPALPDRAGRRAVRARGLRGARLHDARAGGRSHALASRRGRRARRGGRIPRRQGVELREAAHGAALHPVDARAAARAARPRAGARGHALRRADVPDLPPRPGRALDAARRRRRACARAPRTRARARSPSTSPATRGSSAVTAAPTAWTARRTRRPRRSRRCARDRSRSTWRDAADRRLRDTGAMADRNVLGGSSSPAGWTR